VKDIMEALRQARPAHLSGDGAIAQTVRAAELSRALMHSPITERRHRRHRIAILPVAATGVAGAAALAAIAVGGTPTSPSSPAPVPVPLNGTSAFLAAASKAETQPAGAFWNTDRIVGQSYIVPEGYAITGAHSEYFEWTAVKASGGEQFYGRGLPARPATEKDTAAWRAAGSPSSFRVFSNDHYATYTTKAGPWQADTPGKGGHFYLPGNSPIEGMTNEQIQALPTDPAALTKLFFEPSSQAKVAARGPKSAGVLAMWDPARQVLRASEIFNAPVPPKVRAGVMRALAELPGVRQLDTVTDPLGRRGIAIGADWTAGHPVLKHTAQGDQVTWVKSGSASEREQLIFDEKTGAYLGIEQVLVTPGGEYRTQAPGFVINYELMRSSGWTDTKPAPPDTLPFQ
jgi:hypothetical protein